MLYLKRKAEGSTNADDFSAFYLAHERLIRGTLFHLVGTNDLDDLVQLTFIRCWENRERFEGRSKASTWITRIAVNLARDHWRERRAEKAGGKATSISIEDCPAHDVADERALESSERRDLRQALEQALKRLSFEHRTVMALMYFQDCTIEEIAEATGERVGTVKSRLHYAKDELRGILGKMEIEI